tara:strand:- start:314 stop:778 length:465 start_codon:yes stop_codon:yes gene_type:complete
MDFEKEIALDVSKKLSKKICEKITRQTIKKLQLIDSKLSEIKTLKNVWDDVCYQYQKEMSNDWRHYDQKVASLVLPLVKDLESYELNAILLQSQDLKDRAIHTLTNKVAIISKYQAMDLSEFEYGVTRYIIKEYIYKEANVWLNDRLRKAVRIS